MRHQNKINQLGRTSTHRNAMLSNMASSLISHKRVSTTLAKAKALRGFVEPLITKSKSDTTHSRRMVFRKLQDKDAVSELFREVAPKVADRPGGYTRIIKTGFRQGDAAEMCIIELVDFNEIYTTDEKAAGAKKTRRSRRGSGGAASKPAAAAPAKETKAAAAEVKAEEAEVVEETEEVKAEAKAEEVKTEEVKEDAAEEPAKDETADEDDKNKEGAS